MVKKYKSKWGVLGISPKQLNKIYNKKRLIAKELLKKKHPKQYSLILNKLMFEEYLKRTKKNLINCKEVKLYNGNNN
jgi:hypothetical protein